MSMADGKLSLSLNNQATSTRTYCRVHSEATSDSNHVYTVVDL